MRAQGDRRATRAVRTGRKRQPMSLHAKSGGRAPASPARRSKGLRRRRVGRQELRALRPRLELMEDRTLMATMVWNITGGGDWNVDANWVNSANSLDHHVPISADDAQINTTGI